MIIDMHTHFTPEKLPEMRNLAGSNLWPIMEMTSEQTGNVLISGKVFRKLTNQSWDANRRIEDMDKEGIDIQVISPMPELLSYWFEPEDTLEFSRYINDKLSELVQVNPKRFYGLGMVPLQDPQLAARELKRLKKDFNLIGVEVGSNVNGRPIGDPYFHPFFEAAEEEGMAIFVHPLHPLGKERLIGPMQLQAYINFPFETGWAGASLITGGVLEKYPNLRIALSHGGGSLFSILPRLEHGWKTNESLKALMKKSPMEYGKKLYFDTLVYDELTLRHLINLIGTSNLLIGSDYPYLIREKSPGNRVKMLNLTEEVEKSIFKANSLKFLGI
ncbi:aminocarboxymuconate-semialdehyde decarboxylase [Neobacillus niacini]|uniref:amidohydrolase family protein n=1 Tax=Neobacillus niacini TaxID=86668 RepID=UPI002786ECF8|nr:amidohydrolase family protein [Neobacillus niacini]MDQ1002207.1 aminocarboxymuconate-semialdehyde decarboxylase [Neobacillus niacini]